MFQQLANNIRSIDPWEVYKPILEKYFSWIEETNKNQLSEGIKSDNSAMPDYASIEYANFKKQFIPTYKAPFMTTDLRYEGNFYKGIKAKFDLFGIEIESLDSKAEKLEAKYGSLIYGLTDESINKLIEMSIDEYIESIYEKIMEGV